MSLTNKRIFLSLSAFLYSLLFRIAVDIDVVWRILLWFSEDGRVSLSEINRLITIFYIVLALGLVCFVVFKFEMIKGSFVFPYLSSLLPFIFIPFRGGWAIPWYMGRGFAVGVSVVMAVLIGPPMIMWITFVSLKLYKKWRNKK